MENNSITININAQFYNYELTPKNDKIYQTSPINLKQVLKTTNSHINFSNNQNQSKSENNSSSCSNNSQDIKKNSFDNHSKNNSNNYSVNNNSEISNDKNSVIPNMIITSNEVRNKKNKEIEKLFSEYLEKLFPQQNQINIKIRYVCTYCNKNFNLNYIYEINNNKWASNYF